MERRHYVTGRIGQYHHPILEEAGEWLDHLDKIGDSGHAFGWSHVFQVKLGQNNSVDRNKSARVSPVLSA